MRPPILVPVDGSPFSEQAIPTALRLARQSGSPIELVIVQEPVVMPESIRLTLMRDPEQSAELAKAGTMYLETIAGRIREETEVEVFEARLEGPVVETLARYTAAESPRMVVMSTHGRGGISRAWLGSVADALVRRVDTPVMLVRPREDVVQRQGATPLREPPNFVRIAVPLDGTSTAEDALPEALEIATGTAIELTLIQILPPPVTYLRPTFTADIASELLADMEKEAERYLERVARGIARPDITVRTRVFVDHNAARGILSFATGGADLIVMTTHARRGLARLVIGSVADKVVRGSPVPVLLVRPQLSQWDDEKMARAGTAASESFTAALPPL